MVSDQAEVAGAGTDADAGPPGRLVAFYLPQFHPIPENDLWWGEGLHRVDERRPCAPVVQGPLPAAASDRPRLLRPPRPRGPRSPGRARARVRRARLLLPSLLVQRAAPARAPAGADAGSRPAVAAVLHLLGERELDAALGRARGRGPPAPGVRGRLGRAVHPRRVARHRRRAIHARRRRGPPARVPGRSAPRRAAGGGALADDRAGGRRRAAPGRRAELRDRRSAAVRIRRRRRVPAASLRPEARRGSGQAAAAAVPGGARELRLARGRDAAQAGPRLPVVPRPRAIVGQHRPARV